MTASVCNLRAHFADLYRLYIGSEVALPVVNFVLTRTVNSLDTIEVHVPGTSSLVQGLARQRTAVPVSLVSVNTGNPLFKGVLASVSVEQTASARQFVIKANNKCSLLSYSPLGGTWYYAPEGTDWKNDWQYMRKVMLLQYQGFSFSNNVSTSLNAANSLFAARYKGDKGNLHDKSILQILADVCKVMSRYGVRDEKEEPRTQQDICNFFTGKFYLNQRYNIDQQQFVKGLIDELGSILKQGGTVLEGVVKCITSPARFIQMRPANTLQLLKEDGDKVVLQPSSMFTEPVFQLDPQKYTRITTFGSSIPYTSFPDKLYLHIQNQAQFISEALSSPVGNAPKPGDRVGTCDLRALMESFAQAQRICQISTGQTTQLISSSDNKQLKNKTRFSDARNAAVHEQKLAKHKHYTLPAWLQLMPGGEVSQDFLDMLACSFAAANYVNNYSIQLQGPLTTSPGQEEYPDVYVGKRVSLSNLAFVKGFADLVYKQITGFVASIEITHKASAMPGQASSSSYMLRIENLTTDAVNSEVLFPTNFLYTRKRPAAISQRKHKAASEEGTTSKGASGGGGASSSGGVSAAGASNNKSAKGKKENIKRVRIETPIKEQLKHSKL